MKITIELRRITFLVVMSSNICKKYKNQKNLTVQISSHFKYIILYTKYVCLNIELDSNLLSYVRAHRSTSSPVRQPPVCRLRRSCPEGNLGPGV